MMIRLPTLRWTSTGESYFAAVLDVSIVGTVVKDAFGSDWWAYGCMSDWQDTKLGFHATDRKAKAAVQRWVEENF